MKRLIAEWLWRAAIVGALAWIGWELHQLRLDLQPPADDEVTAEAAAPDELQDRIDDIDDQLAALLAKVDAIMVAMAQLAR